MYRVTAFQPEIASSRMERYLYSPSGAKASNPHYHEVWKASWTTAQTKLHEGLQGAASEGLGCPGSSWDAMVCHVCGCDREPIRSQTPLPKARESHPAPTHLSTSPLSALVNSFCHRVSESLTPPFSSALASPPAPAGAPTFSRYPPPSWISRSRRGTTAHPGLGAHSPQPPQLLPSASGALFSPLLSLPSAVVQAA